MQQMTEKQQAEFVRLRTTDYRNARAVWFADVVIIAPMEGDKEPVAVFPNGTSNILQGARIGEYRGIKLCY